MVNRKAKIPINKCLRLLDKYFIFLKFNQVVIFFLEETISTIKPITGEKMILQNRYPQNPIIRFIPKTPIIKLRAKYIICIVGGKEKI